MNLKELQNGSDIRGIAMGDGQNLTTDAADAISQAFAIWLSQRTHKTDLKVAIGRDSRITGPDLVNACVGGLTAQGVNVMDCGMASTPAMFMTTVDDKLAADGAIMVTASHLPMNRNGLKFFTKDGGLEKEDIARIIEIAEAPMPPAEGAGSVARVDFMASYSNHLANLVRQASGSDRPLEGMRIVVDAGNGAGGFYATQVLEPLGADTTGSRYLEPDGTFPNHIPNPENKEAMQSIVDAVKESDADFGIIFDTDVDRAGAVDKGGAILNKDRLIAAISAILLRDHPGTTIVTDSITSTGLKDFIEGLGGRHHRFKRGYRNVINESMRLNSEGEDSQLAIETSGHAALKDNYFLDDGAYLVTRLLIELGRLRKEGKTIADLIASLGEPVESEEFRLPIVDKDFRAYGADVLQKCEEAFAGRQDEGVTIAPDNHEGVRVYFGPDKGNGWFLLRMSLHEPLMPLNVQSDEEGGVVRILRSVYDFLLKFPSIDSRSITSFLH